MDHTIATRGSTLALWQARHVQSLLGGVNCKADLLKIQTTGDKVQDRFLHEIGGKGLFVKEVEQALIDGRADIAVHSLKDLPVKTPENFELTAILPRHSPYDLMIFKKQTAQRLGLKPEYIIGKQDVMLFGKVTIATGSLRRSCLLKEASNTVNTVGIRGNVDTRLKKLAESSEWDAIILAEASIERLGISEEFETRRLDPEWFVPSASQGALVIETIKGSAASDTIKKLDCKKTHEMVDLERQILAKLGGDCTMPFGCHFAYEPREGGSEVLVGRAVIAAQDGSTARSELYLPTEYRISSEKIVFETLKKLKDDGGPAIMDKLNLRQPNW